MSTAMDLLAGHTGMFVVGTDTGVGKTRISCALLEAASRSGRRTLAMKPVASGCNGRDDDILQLNAYANTPAPGELVAPYAFAPAIAPHLAAQQAGVGISLERLGEACRQLQSRADLLVVEGVGGFCVPLDARHTTADLAVVLGLPLLLVVGMRLGCLNHALLTLEAIQRRQLPLAGWIANPIDPDMAELDANVESLRQRIPAPLLCMTQFGESVAEIASRLVAQGA